MENENFTPEQSLMLINQMIHTAKKEISDNGFHYLLWGWLVFAAAVGNFIMIKIDFEYAFITWPILMPLGGIIAMIYGFSQKKKNQKRVKTMVDHIFIYTWIAFGVTLLITLFVSGKVGWETTYPFIMLLYGIGTFISGGIMKFKPLIVGGIICWIGGTAAFFLNFEYQLLVLIGVVLCGYIIPGHILQNKYRKHV